jgi:hypothetical protein
MKYTVNTLVATLVKKEDAQKGAVGAVIGIKEPDDPKGKEMYLVELFNVPGHIHDQIFYSDEEIYEIQQ